MNRRAKLNLNPGQATHKKQPADFSARTNADSSDRQTGFEQQADDPAWQVAGARQDKVAQGSMAWSNPTQLLKVALVVAAAGLSIYLLKRRFF
jgi:hypothetical protein